jgi:hypothetical protein
MIRLSFRFEEMEFMCLLKVEEAKNETDSGLLLTSAAKEQPTIGTVSRQQFPLSRAALSLQTACIVELDYVDSACRSIHT